MKSRIIGLSLLAVASVTALSVALRSYAQTRTYSGTVARVWEDGFSLDTGDRRLRVDSWDLYGDRTPREIQVGDRLTVTGEFDDGEFDASAIRDQDATAASPAPSDERAPVAAASGNRHTGTVVDVWEDGFSLDTGDRRLRVDSWDLYGDRTPREIQVGDRLTVTGEFDDGEFDASAIAPAP